MQLKSLTFEGWLSYFEDEASTKAMNLSKRGLYIKSFFHEFIYWFNFKPNILNQIIF